MCVGAYFSHGFGASPTKRSTTRSPSEVSRSTLIDGIDSRKACELLVGRGDDDAKKKKTSSAAQPSPPSLKKKKTVQ